MNSLDSQLASVETEDVSMANDDIRVWTINVGGITGLWKLSHWLETISYESRPKVLLIQDANMSEEHAKSINYFWDKLGYKFFLSVAKRQSYLLLYLLVVIAGIWLFSWMCGKSIGGATNGT